ncbi:hypothetical protein VNO77_27458 [Canavalia gladiata]|uniref:Uncharacterized protein n=1 Tax=Canavalia gladiata TaxID=3824 RepID=A0AAN9KUT5_CANGL
MLRRGATHCTFTRGAHVKVVNPICFLFMKPQCKSSAIIVGAPVRRTSTLTIQPNPAQTEKKVHTRKLTWILHFPVRMYVLLLPQCEMEHVLLAIGTEA